MLRTLKIAGLALTGLMLATQAMAVTPDKSDPLYQAKGDHERTYKFAEAGIDSPYRLYVPENWDGKKKLPLVVMLHGSNLNHDAPLDREPADLKGIIKREADKHGYIVVAPEGYKGGSYGNTFPIPLTQYLHPGGNAPRGPHRPDRPAGEEFLPASPIPSGPPRQGQPGQAGEQPPPQQRMDPTAPELNNPRPVAKALTPEERDRENKLSEQDVLNVIALVSKEYNTDPKRLYIMGNSMGMIGTLSLAAKYPQMFAAIGPSDGPVDPVFYPAEKLKGIAGAIVVHGEDDNVAPIDDSEMIVFRLKSQGIDAQFHPVAKGGHGDSWYKSLPEVFDFFASHPKK